MASSPTRISHFDPSIIFSCVSDEAARFLVALLHHFDERLQSFSVRRGFVLNARDLGMQLIRLRLAKRRLRRL